MNTTSISVRSPNCLIQPIEQRWRALGYRTRSEYILGLMIYDLMTQRPHPVTLEISRIPEDERHLVHQEIASMIAAGTIASNNYWFKGAIRAAVADVAGGKEVNETKVVQQLLKKVRDGKA